MFLFHAHWMPFYLVRERGFSTVEMRSWRRSVRHQRPLRGARGWVSDRLIVNGRSANTVYKFIMPSLTWLRDLHGVHGLGSATLALGALSSIRCCGRAVARVYAIPQILAGPSATAVGWAFKIP